MVQNDFQGYTSEDWWRIVRVFQQLLAPGEVDALARALVETLAREFNLAAVQVWLRAGELNTAGLSLTHLAEELELVAQRQDPAHPAAPLRIPIHDSLSGFVATEGVPYHWSPGSSSPPEWEDAQWAGEAGYSFGLAVPLTVHGRSIGTLTVWETGERETFPEGLALLVGEHASLALTQNRRLSGMKRQVQWLTGLQQVTGLLAGRFSPDELYRLIFEQIARILSIGAFSINLYDEDANQIERVLIVETEEDQYRFRPREPWKPVDGTIWERVVKTREPILINRAVRGPVTQTSRGDTRIVERPEPDPKAAASLMFAPMMLGDRVIGVLSAQSYTPSAYDQETLDLLATVANQAALAIENARLLNQLNSQIQETQKANRLKSQFIANISHEVRTPLNSIIGFTRIVKRRASTVLPEQQVANLDHVLESADHLLRLINDLLDLSRMEAGRLQVYPESIDLRRLVVRTVGELEPLMEQSGAEVLLDIDEGMGPVRTDATRMRQILLNLLSNGFKFARESKIHVAAGRVPSLLPPEGEWRVSVPTSKVSSPTTPPFGYPGEGMGSEPPAEEYFFVEVRDEGPGMDPSTVSELFEEFRQASSGDSRLHPGTGLGLAIVQRITELMKGSVWVKTKIGEGSTFRVVLAELTPSRETTPHPGTPAPPPTPLSGESLSSQPVK